MFKRITRFTVSLLLLTAMVVFCSCTSPAVEPDDHAKILSGYSNFKRVNFLPVKSTWL